MCADKCDILSAARACNRREAHSPSCPSGKRKGRRKQRADLLPFSLVSIEDRMNVAGRLARAVAGGVRSMSCRIRGKGLDGPVFAFIAALGLIVPAARADEPSPEQVLRETGLVRSVRRYVFKEEEDLGIGSPRSAGDSRNGSRSRPGWMNGSRRSAGCVLQHQEIMKKLRALENGGRPDRRNSGLLPSLTTGPVAPVPCPRPRFGPFPTWSRPPSPAAGWYGWLRPRPDGRSDAPAWGR